MHKTSHRTYIYLILMAVVVPTYIAGQVKDTAQPTGITSPKTLRASRTHNPPVQTVSKFAYTWPIEVTRVVDGDTFNCDINMGLGITFTNQRIRLLGCDTYEVRGEHRALGLLASQVAKDFFKHGSNFHLQCSDKRDSFGRILGNVLCGCGCNQLLKDLQINANLVTGRFE